YPTLLKALIVQSMIKIEEDKITVICREADISAVKSVVDVSAITLLWGTPKRKLHPQRVLQARVRI
ncbi:unnamed protein product, partial [Ectocarpus sp. 12 AP-2014]